MLLRKFGMATGLTETRHIHEKLRDAQGFLQPLIASAIDAIITLDDQQRIVAFLMRGTCHS
jgi:hypothetical protein